VWQCVAVGCKNTKWKPKAVYICTYTCTFINTHTYVYIFIHILVHTRRKKKHTQLAMCGLQGESKMEDYNIDDKINICKYEYFGLILLLLLRKKWSSSFVGSSMCYACMFRFIS